MPKTKSHRDVSAGKKAEEVQRKLNAELEEKLAQRTAQLSEATEQLNSIFDFKPLRPVPPQPFPWRRKEKAGIPGLQNRGRHFAGDEMRRPSGTAA